MKIHLVTVAGAYVKILPYMLDHYRKLGIESFLINVHLNREDDPALESVERITADFGCRIASITIGQWLQTINPEIYAASRQSRPNDWFILADQDELQIYPRDLHSIIEECEARGYDYIEGAFVDRIARDGSFPALQPEKPIWEQFPLGGYISRPILDANPRKIVAAKGRVKVGPGQHDALSGKGCPVDEYFIQVHHFKWVDDVVKRLKQRIDFYKQIDDPLWQESARFIDYCNEHEGRIDIADPRFYVSECDPEYKYWDRVKELCRRPVGENL